MSPWQVFYDFKKCKTSTTDRNILHISISDISVLLVIYSSMTLERVFERYGYYM